MPILLKAGSKIFLLCPGLFIKPSWARITSGAYKEFQEVFIAYYADRIVDYGETLPAGFEAKYRLIIRPKDHDPLNQESKRYLDANFAKFEDENFVWYKI